MSRHHLVLVLVRHADALGRSAWTRPDAERPLSSKGERQAEALVGPLATLAPLEALTSPARRCADTLAPFARRAGLALRYEPLLAEGASPKDAFALLLDALAALAALAAGDAGDAGALEGPALVACSHGDVVDGIASLLAAEGVALEDGGGAGGHVLPETPKAGRWEIDVAGREVHRARLVGPPDRAR